MNRKGPKQNPGVHLQKRSFIAQIIRPLPLKLKNSQYLLILFLLLLCVKIHSDLQEKIEYIKQQTLIKYEPKH